MINNTIKQKAKGESIMTENKEQGLEQFNIGSENTEGAGKKAGKEQAPKEAQPQKWNDITYRKLYQGNATNSLSQAIIFRQPPEQAQLELFTFEGKEAFKTTIALNKNFSISFLDSRANKPLVLSTGAQKLLDTMTIRFTEQVDHKLARDGQLKIDDLKVELPLSDYVKALGKDPNNKKDTDNAREKAKKELDELYGISIHYEKGQTAGAKNKRKDVGANDFLDSRVITKKGIYNGVISFTFAPDFGRYLGKSYIAKYPMKLLQISTQQSPLPFFIGRLLMLQNNIPSHIIGIRTIIDKAIESGLLPSIEEQRKKGELKRRFITPLEKALDTLYKGGVITDWGYSRGSRNKLTDREKENTTFDDLLNMYFFFEMPETEQQIQEKGDEQST